MGNSNKILAVGIVLLSAALLLGARFDATWAGGTGERHALVTTPGGATYERGEIISWEDTDQFLIGYATVFLDEGTEVKIVSSVKNKEVITVVQGRVLIWGPLVVETREVDVAVSSVTSIVHYSWLDEIEVMNIAGAAILRIDGVEQHIEVGQGIRTSTLPPYTNEPFVVDLDASTAAAFYHRIPDLPWPAAD